MKRLLFVAPSIKYGGAAKNFIGVANYAAQEGYKVFLLTEEGRETMRYVDPRIVRLTATIDSEGSFFKRWFQAIKAVRRATRKTNADLVISFIELWRSASIIATRFSHTKCLVSERADPYSRGNKHDKMIFRIFEMAEAHVFQTEQARDYFGKRTRKNCRVIPNPVFKDDILPPYTGEKENMIVNIARLDLRQKRQDVLIRAFAKIADKFPEYTLFLYGGDGDEEKINSIIKETGYEDRIRLMGVTRNIHDVLSKAKLLVLSSDFEGIPNVVIEGMCVGVPVVSTKCSPGGAELLIEHGVNGMLVERGDVDGLAATMAEVLYHPEKAELLVQHGFDIKSRFDERMIMDQWMDYIKAI